MGKFNSRAALIAACASPLAALSLGGPALAQDPGAAPADGLEIVVTAQKRSETLRETPIAITVVSGEAVEARGLTALDDIAALSPSFRIETGENANDTRITLRGISANAVELAQAPSVGIYVDGVYQSGRQGLNVDLLDVGQIEILRGPQGVIFGRNTAAGALNITTRRPPQDFEARVSSEIGEDEYWRVAGGVGGPLIENALFARAAAYATERDGYVRNTINGRLLGGGEGHGVRGSLLYDQGGAFTANLTADYAYDFTLSNPKVPDYRARRVAFNNPHDDEREVYGAALTLTYDFGSVALTSITANRTWSDLRRDDSDASPVSLIFSTNDVTSETLSQEIRLADTGDGAFHWLIGAYLSDETIDSRTDLTLLGDSGVSVQKLDDKSYALFGQASYAFNPRVKLTLGGRQTKDERDVSDNQTGFVPGLIGSPTGPVLNEVQTDYNVFTGRVALNVALTPDHMAYAVVSQGYRAGGVNVAVAAPTDSYAPEESLNYELGLKSSLFARRLQTSLAAFYIDYQDLQVFLTDPLTNANYTANSDEARTYGLEIEVTAELTDQLLLTAALGWTEAEYVRFANCDLTPVTDCSGNAIQNAPDLTAALRVDYERPLGALLLFAGADVNYTGETYLAATNRPESLRGAYTLANGELGLRGQARTWSIAAWGRNIFDEAYISGYLEASPLAADSYTLGQPQSFGLRATRTF